MNKQEVFEFLGKSGVAIDLHEQCKNFTGGRTYHLKKLTANLIDKGLSFEGNESD
jgi:hypothetical protein